QLSRIPRARGTARRPRGGLGERNRRDEALRERGHGGRHRAGGLGEATGMNVRPLVDEDAPTVAALISAEEERLYGRPGRLTGADILMFLQYSKESWIWEEDGRVVASASYGVYGDAGNVRGVVADKGRGIGTEINERGGGFGRAQGTKKILAAPPEPDPAARVLLESRGYHEVRRFYEMAIELTEEPAAPVVPGGLVPGELREQWDPATC